MALAGACGTGAVGGTAEPGPQGTPEIPLEAGARRDASIPGLRTAEESFVDAGDATVPSPDAGDARAPDAGDAQAVDGAGSDGSSGDASGGDASGEDASGDDGGGICTPPPCAAPPPDCHYEGGDLCTTCGTMVCPDAGGPGGGSGDTCSVATAAITALVTSSLACDNASDCKAVPLDCRAGRCWAAVRTDVDETALQALLSTVSQSCFGGCGCNGAVPQAVCTNHVCTESFGGNGGGSAGGGSSGTTTN